MPSYGSTHLIFAVLPREIEATGDPVTDGAAVVKIFGQGDGVADGSVGPLFLLSIECPDLSDTFYSRIL